MKVKVYTFFTYFCIAMSALKDIHNQKRAILKYISTAHFCSSFLPFSFQNESKARLHFFLALYKADDLISFKSHSLCPTECFRLWYYIIYGTVDKDKSVKKNWLKVLNLNEKNRKMSLFTILNDKTVNVLALNEMSMYKVLRSKATAMPFSMLNFFSFSQTEEMLWTKQENLLKISK